MRLLAALALAMLTALAVPGTVEAQAGSHDRARSAVQAGEIRPLEDILGRLRRTHPGRLLDADLRQRGGNGPWLYDIRLLQKDGRVVSLTVDARTGRVLSAQ